MPYNNYYNAFSPVQPQYPNPPSTPILNRVRDEQDVNNFPVAPGVTAFFIDENSQTIFSKYVDASQMDRPRIVKFQRVPEEKPVVPEYVTKEEFMALWNEVAALKTPVAPPTMPTILGGMPSEVKQDEHAVVQPGVQSV